jgi:hypothetical protein
MIYLSSLFPAEGAALLEEDAFSTVFGRNRMINPPKQLDAVKSVMSQ